MPIPRDETGDVLGADHVDERADLELLAGKPPCFPKCRHKKQAAMDTSLLHCSARLEKINKGYNPSSALLSASGDVQGQSSSKAKSKGKVPMSVDDPLYEGHSVPGAPLAPHLCLGNVQAIGSGFYKMPPSAVFEEALLPGDDE
jgi:hypothetical protein